MNIDDKIIGLLKEAIEALPYASDAKVRIAELERKHAEEIARKREEYRITLAVVVAERKTAIEERDLARAELAGADEVRKSAKSLSDRFFGLKEEIATLKAREAELKAAYDRQNRYRVEDHEMIAERDREITSLKLQADCQNQLRVEDREMIRQAKRERDHYFRRMNRLYDVIDRAKNWGGNDDSDGNDE